MKLLDEIEARLDPEDIRKLCAALRRAIEQRNDLLLDDANWFVSTIEEARLDEEIEDTLHRRN